MGSFIVWLIRTLRRRAFIKPDLDEGYRRFLCSNIRVLEGSKPKSGSRSDQWAQDLHCYAKHIQISLYCFDHLPLRINGFPPPCIDSFVSLPYPLLSRTVQRYTPRDSSDPPSSALFLTPTPSQPFPILQPISPFIFRPFFSPVTPDTMAPSGQSTRFPIPSFSSASCTSFA